MRCPPSPQGGRVMRSRSRLLAMVGTALLRAVAGMLAAPTPAPAATVNYLSLSASFSSGTAARRYAARRSHVPNARLIVLGCPRLFELTSSCGLFGMDLNKRRSLDGAADTLAGVIAGRAAAAGDTFVDVRGSFAGHGICAGTPWINTTTWPVTDSYHPNSSGYRSGYLPALVGVTG